MVHVKSRLRRSEPVMNHGYTCACVFGSWVDTVYDVYETVTFMYAALSSRRWVTTKVCHGISIVYYLRFTIDHEAITKSLVVACILNGMSSGASIRKYSIRGRFIGSWKGRAPSYMHRIYGRRNFYPTYHTFFILLASSFFLLSFFFLLGSSRSWCFIIDRGE